MTLALGIDLGGTKIEIIALDPSGGVLLRRRRDSPRGDYQKTLDAVAALIAEAEAELGARGTVGFGTPGAISPATGLMKNSNATWLNGRPFDADLVARLGRPAAFANDANVHSDRFYRFMNEVPTLLLIGIVILAVVKPF